MSEWQPWWLAFARAHGIAPEEGDNARYMAWIGGQWRQWRAEVGKGAHAPISDADQAAFGAWLEDRCPPKETQ